MNSENNISRRGFLKGLAASGIGAGVLLNLNGETTPNLIEGGKRAKNLILMVSDGMNNGTFSAVNHWLDQTENRDSAWMKLYSDKLAVRRLAETSCADSLVTDSAAASSAWGIGQRVNMGSINTMPDGSKPTPIAMLAKAKGKSAGMVSTARITHATPAGFAANVRLRGMEPIIAEQYLKRSIDVLLGGGNEFFDPTVREDGVDLYASYRNAGYKVVRNRNELLKTAVSDQPLLGVFSNDHIPYYIDRVNDAAIGERTPSLEAMTTAALDRLSRNSNGFVLQIEAGRVDHAAHVMDPASLIYEQLEFDRTISVVREFVEKHGDTLVVVTTDHGTGGFMLNGGYDGYEKAKERLLKLKNCRGSLETLKSRTDPDNLRDTLIPAVESTLNIKLDDAERERVFYALEFPEVRGLDDPLKLIGLALRSVLFDRFCVSWTSNNHTADLVELAMFGPGSEILPGYVENWELYAVFREVLGV